MQRKKKNKLKKKRWKLLNSKKRSWAFHVHPSHAHNYDAPSKTKKTRLPLPLFFLHWILVWLHFTEQASMAAATLSCNSFPQRQLQFWSFKNSSHFIHRSFRFHEKPHSSSLPRKTINGVTNAQIGKTEERSVGYRNGKIYRRLDSCLVIPPAKGKKPKALIKFLGGAFIGAVPEVTYR